MCLQLTQEITAAVVAAPASSYAHQPLVQAYRSSHHRRSEGRALCPAEFQKRARYNCEADLQHVPAFHLCSTFHQCSAFLLCIALLFILHSCCAPHCCCAVHFDSALLLYILTSHCTAVVHSNFALLLCTLNLHCTAVYPDSSLHCCCAFCLCIALLLCIAGLF